MKQKKKTLRRLTPLLILIVVLAVSLVTLELARFVMHTDEVVNNFVPDESVNPTVHEQFKDNVKSDVYIQAGDTGYPVYIRARIVVTWQDKTGIVYYKMPVAGTDYEIKLNETDWIKGEHDFYYYPKAVASSGDTPILIETCKPQTEAPAEDYALHVEIIAQSVQAIGYTDGENSTPELPAYQDAWNISTLFDSPKNESSSDDSNNSSEGEEEVDSP